MVVCGVERECLWGCLHDHLIGFPCSLSFKRLHIRLPFLRHYLLLNRWHLNHCLLSSRRLNHCLLNIRHLLNHRLLLNNRHLHH